MALPSSDPGRGDSGRPARHFRATDLAWIGLLVVAVALPVGGTADWLTPVYTTTREDLVAGLMLLKASAGILAILGLVTTRLPSSKGVPETRARNRTGDVIALAALVVIAIGLRLYRLNTELWLDEIEMLVRYVPLETRQLVSTYDSQNHHPLYTILARYAYLAAGGAEWAVRIPAVVFGVASIAAMWIFARRIVSETEATLTALVLAVSYHHVWFSQNARGYTAILVFCIVATGLLLRLADEPGPRPSRIAWAYGAVMAVATWTHLTAALIAIGHLVALLSTTRWRQAGVRVRLTWPLIALALSGVISILLYSPMLPQLLGEMTAPADAGVSEVWTSPRWLIGEMVRALSGGVPGGLLAVVAALSVLGIGVGSLWRRSPRAAALMFVPVAVTAIAVMAAGHNLWPRFFFFAAGFLVLAAIRGGFTIVRALVRWHPERVATVGACVVALASLFTLPRAWEPKQQFRAALDFVNVERRPDDAVVALDVAQNVYLLRRWAPNWYLTRSRDLLADVERSATRTWIVYTLPTRLQAISPALWDHIAAPRYNAVRTFSATVGGGEIHVLRHDSTDER